MAVDPSSATGPVQGLLFDLGGVLLRTEDPAPRERLAARFDLTRAQLEALVFEGPTGLAAQRGAYPLEAHFARVRRALGLSEAEWPAFWRQFWAGDRVDWTLVAWLEALRSRYRLGLLSNAWPTLRPWLAARPRLAALWHAVVISAEVGLLKPDPAIYQHALAALGLPAPAVLFVDDNPANVAAARQVGLRAVRFTGRKALRTALQAHGVALPPAPRPKPRLNADGLGGKTPG